MNKIFLICISMGFSVLSLHAQTIDKTIFNDNMETVQYELPELVVKDSTLLSDIDFHVIRLAESTKYYDKEKYFRIFFTRINSDISVVIEQSKYPVKQKDSFGYFDYRGKIFIVSGLKISQLFEESPKICQFSYRDYIQPTIFMIEDDSPRWSFRFINGRLFPKNTNVD